MGNDKLFDQFVYLHFAMGIIAYFWGINLKHFIILHTVYEIFELTPFGVNIINKYFKNIWPGDGKTPNEFGMNALGDTIGGVIGWLSAREIDRMGNRYGWYEIHIK